MSDSGPEHRFGLSQIPCPNMEEFREVVIVTKQRKSSIKTQFMGGLMAQQIKVLATKLDNPSLTPVAHKENENPQAVL